ncbi:MAG TPA: OFA family MFS transporter [Acidobacteriota bacterium]|nr:OFA family MFS transporter [Acidobacteriota bacterium]
MSDVKVMNRWMVVLGAVLIQLCLGAIYAWSVFTPILIKAPYSLSTTQTQWIFGVGLASFAVVMIIAGRMQAKYPPRNVAALGGIVLGLGYVAASFVGASFPGLLICIGLIGGAGIGLAYVVPIAVGVKWFPDRKGMLTGLAVAGFGFGALVWVKLAGSWGHLLENFGISTVFLVYGIAFAAIVTVGSLWMVNPPSGYIPEGWKPPELSADGKAAGSVDLDSGSMLRTPQFYALWVMFIAGASAGLMVIGCIKLFGIDALRSSGMTEAEASATAGTAMAVFFALANGLGRIGWGILSDKLGRKLSLFLMLLFQGIVMLVFYQMGSSVALLYLGSAVIGFNFGGNFALFPAATADLFGARNVGPNYGWVFTAYGVGGIVGPVLAGRFRAAAEGGDPSVWVTPFVIAGVACLVACCLTLFLKTPQKVQSLLPKPHQTKLEARNPKRNTDDS